MFTDYTIRTEQLQHTHEVEDRLERRRVAAERAVQPFDGDRIALLAHLARSGRATRAVAARPLAC